MPAYLELGERDAMHIHHRDESPLGLVMSKKRQDSMTDSKVELSPQSSRGPRYHGSGSQSPARRHITNTNIDTVIQDVVMQTRRKIISDFDSIDAISLDSMTIKSFSDYIARERLSTMPHRGSLWDRVLRWAEFYALQVAAYSDIITPFVPESHYAAKQIYSLLKSLLELGETNAPALDITFGVFYKVGLSLAFLSTHEGKLALDSHIREDVGRAFHDIHTLVFDVASHYQRSVRGLSNGSITLDFINLFRDQLNTFYGRKSLIIHHIWRHSLGEEGSRDVQKVRTWLSPRSDLVKSTNIGNDTRYDEFTCEWFQRHLLDFTRSDKPVMAITAGAGSGKTILSNWIQERLQRPLDRKIYNTIMFTFDADFPSQTTSLALAKGLALQLLDLHVGNIQMFEAIVEAYYCEDAAAVEEHLWSAIGAAYSKAPEPSVIIIDGMEQLSGSVSHVCTHLSKLSSRHSSVRTIILSRPDDALSAKTNEWKSFQITPDYVHEDIMHIAEHALQGCQQFLTLKESERTTVLDKLIENAKGSFLYLSLAMDLLRVSKSTKDFQKTMADLPQSIDIMIAKRAENIEATSTDMKLLLSYMLVAERPLSIRELYSILQVDLQRKTDIQRQFDITDLIGKTHGLLHMDENEAVRFRHSSVRQHFKMIQAKGGRVLSVKESHTELVLRLLAYSKTYMPSKYEVTLDLPSHADVERTFAESNLLEYAVRNWISHFRHSVLFKPNGAFDFPATFKDVLPASPYMILLEWACWSEQCSISELFAMHDLALRIRTEVFQQKHDCTLQNIITCGFVHYTYSSFTLAAQFFLQASRVGQMTSPKYSKITISCTEKYLSITEMIKFTTRNEMVTCREEMLKFMIAAYKHTLGDTSDVVVRYYKILAELYMTIQEEENAANCWKELHVIMLEKYGEGSDAEREVSGKLTVVLKQHQDVEIEQYSGDIFATDGDHTVVWDAGRIAAFLKLALTLERRKDYHEAEEIYVTLWTRMLHICTHQDPHNIDVRIDTLRIAIAYSQFLQRQERLEEAKSILLVIWTEHQNFGCESEDFYRQLKIVGELMRGLGLLTVSVSIFEKVVQWFKAVGKNDHKDVRHCDDILMKIVEEISKKRSFNKGESTEEMETIMRRLFSTTTVVTKEYLQMTRAAVHFFVTREQWSKAIELLTQCLSLLWTKSSWGGEACLPNEFGDEAIEFSMELGTCYMKCKRHQESLSCYLHLWQAVRSSCTFSDSRRTVVVDVLTKFYREHKRWKLLIELYKELLIEYRRNLGRSHERTIAILYVLGDATLEHGHGYPEDYYREIVEVVGSSNAKSSFRAHKMLCQIYYDENNWVELKIIGSILWDLLIAHHEEHDFDPEFVEMLYIRYVYVLRHHDKSDHKRLCQIALQYKQVCILKFGPQSPVAVRAMIEYASVLMENDITKCDAVDAYEEIMTIYKNSKPSILDDATWVLIKKHMADAYIHAHNHGSASPATIEKAIIMLQERHQHLKSNLGSAHQETLAIFMQLISMYFKLDGAKYKNTVLLLLRESVIDIITKEQKSQVLVEAATLIGHIYVTYGLHSQGSELVHRIRRQVIAGHNGNSKDALKLDKSIGRLSFVFLVTLETKLKGSVNNSYSEIMADWLTELVLFENYKRCLTAPVKVEVLLMRGARLRSFWAARHERQEEILMLDEKVYTVFNEQFGAAVKTRPEMVKFFLVAVLLHLGSSETHNKEMAMVEVASIAGNNKITELLKAGKYQEAQEVGHCTFHFVMSQGGYHKIKLIGLAFTLAGCMAGRSVNKTEIPAEVRGKMLSTSREVMAEVLHACKNLRINFQRLHDHELNDLVELLGEQENYKELEAILESLWNSRHGQKHWSEDTLIKLGLRLVQSRHLAGNTGEAIHLAEDISYNLYRVLGGLHPHALSMSKLLSQLYTNAGQHSSALAVHEQILQLIVSGDDDGNTLNDARIARKQFDLLKAAYQRNGGWVRSASVYKKLANNLLSLREFRNATEFADMQPIQEWVPKQDDNTARLGGTFVKPTVWQFIVDEEQIITDYGHEVCVEVHGDEVGELRSLPIGKKSRESGWSLRRISENWGMSIASGRDDRINGNGKMGVAF